MSKKVIAIMLICVAVVASTATVAVVKSKNSVTATEVCAGENQRVAYAYVSSITGNEIVYTELEESVVTAALENTDSNEDSDTDTEDTANRNGKTDKMTQMNAGEEGNIPEGEAPEGEMPEGEMPEGEMQKAQMSQGKSNSITTQIPVGTVVHTSEGAATTFSRLVAGDILEMLLETNADGEEVIVEIWMLQA